MRVWALIEAEANGPIVDVRLSDVVFDYESAMTRWAGAAADFERDHPGSVYSEGDGKYLVSAPNANVSMQELDI